MVWTTFSPNSKNNYGSPILRALILSHFELGIQMLRQITFLLFAVLLSPAFKSLACNGAGMTQLFPLAIDQNGHYWVLNIQTIRHDFADQYESHAHLMLIDQAFIRYDSIWVYDFMPIENHTSFVEHDQYPDPVVSVDSIYTMGTQLLKEKQSDLQWLVVLGYSAFAERGESPLTFIREEKVDTSYGYDYGLEGEDSNEMYIDTANIITGITCFGKTYRNLNIRDQGSIFGEFGYLNPGKVTMASCRLYQLPDGYLLSVHLNPRSHPQDRDIKWQECRQSTDGMCQAAKDQEFSWHHCGKDYFYFLTN